MPQIEARTRKDIAGFLPAAIQTALDSYQQFSEAQITDSASTPTSQEFKAHHDACKVAIAHLELLIKLARWADLPDPHVEDENKQKILQQAIESGEEELGRNNN